MSMLGRFASATPTNRLTTAAHSFAPLFIRLVRHGLGAAVGIRSPKELWSILALAWLECKSNSAAAMLDLTVTEKETT